MSAANPLVAVVNDPSSSFIGGEILNCYFLLSQKIIGNRGEVRKEGKIYLSDASKER